MAPLGPMLAVAEGIETALTAIVANVPAWAALSSGGIRSLILPEVVRDIMIAADPDTVGMVAARAAPLRWRAEGRRVVVACPSSTDLDFNDLLMMI